MMDPWYTQRESAVGGSRWWGGSITALEQEDRNLPGWPRYRADKWSFSSDLGGTTEYNFRPLGTEVFYCFHVVFCEAAEMAEPSRKQQKWKPRSPSSECLILER